MEICSFNLRIYLLIKSAKEMTPRTFIPKSEVTQNPCNTETYSQVPSFPKYTFSISRR